MARWSIRKKLQALLLVVFLPAVAVIVATGLNQRRSEIEEARRNALLMVKSLTAQQEQIASATKTMLTLLAQLPAVRSLDATECNHLFGEIHRQFPAYSVILAVTPDGNVFAASMPFKPGTINLADRKHVKDAIRTRDFSVGEYIVGRISNVRSLNYTYPVFDTEGDLVAIVIVGFNLDEYARYISKVHPASGVSFAIADWKGVRLFRMPETPTTAAGTPLPPDLVLSLSNGPQYGTYERVSQDGVARIYAFSQLRLREDLPPYLYMLVGIPRDPIMRNANFRLLKNLLLLGISAALAVVAAWIFVGHILIAPLSRLVTATRLFGKGAMNVRTGVPHTSDELGQLAQSFDDTISLLEARDAERKKAEEALRVASAETELFLTCIPSILIGLDSLGYINRWNAAAIATFGVDAADVIGRTLDGCGVQWLRSDFRSEITCWLAATTFLSPEDLAFKRGDETRFVGIGVQPIGGASGTSGLIVTGADITQRKGLEEQLRQAQKLEAVGQLAAGIAHEINTPAQFVGDNIGFLKESWGSIAELIQLSSRMRHEVGTTAAALDLASQRADVDYLLAEVPSAIDHAREGMERISKIVRAMKEFSHPGGKEKCLVDLNHAISTTITVARNEWKYVAEVVTQLDPSLVPVSCMAGEFNQVMLNLIVNAAHAIAASKAGTNGSKGTITISTTQLPDAVRIAIHDTGTGIPEPIRSRVFEPFFTTKPVGKGTGQGLALAHTVIVQRHMGQIWFESVAGTGTTFFVQLPLTPNGEP
jgi:signal transduction histidine kinase/HAMP domain-containing protein